MKTPSPKMEMVYSTLVSMPGTGNAVLVLGIQDLKRRDHGTIWAILPTYGCPLRLGFHKACAKIQECVLDVFTDQGDIMVTVVSMTRSDLMDSSKVGWSADGRCRHVDRHGVHVGQG